MLVVEQPTVSDIGLDVLQKRYLLRDDRGEIVESVDGLWTRVAECVGDVEIEGWKTFWTEKFRALMAEGDFLPNTPTLINAGKEKGQLSACFVLPIEDSMEGIFTTLKDAAIIHKTGGGTGFSFSSLRQEGAMVSNKTGVSTGPISFAKVYDAATDAVKQGSTRRGANMMTFSVHHPDIWKFLDMKTEDGVMTNFNVSVTITDEFMIALKEGRNYPLREPHTGNVTRWVSAAAIWDKIAENATKHAEPGLIFIDRVNRYSPYHEEIVATNPCGEQPLPPYGSCNLGSINLANFVNDTTHEIDWERLREVIYVSVRFLDNVIDANCYPIKEIDEHAKKYRNIGLGPMGWADALIKLGIPYNSESAVRNSEIISRFINTEAHKASCQLAIEKGTPEGAPFAYTPWYGSSYRRNATLTNAAPTGSIAMLVAGQLSYSSIPAGPISGGVEPNFAFEMDRHQNDTVYTQKHYLWEAHTDLGWYNKDAFVSAHDVSPEMHVLHQAAWQKHADAAISKTCNFPKGSTKQDVKTAYKLAYDKGCKGITVYVDGSREGVFHVKDEPKATAEGYCPECGETLIPESGCDICPKCAYSKCSIA